MELVWEEDGQEQSIEIGPDRPEVMLGRHQDCEIRVGRPSVSRRHALFSWSSNGVVVADQGSTAGTFIDGNKITKARVQVGQVVNCGGIMVLLDEPAAAAPVKPAPKKRDDFDKVGSRNSDREDTFFGNKQPSAAPAKKSLEDFDMDIPRRGSRGAAEPAAAKAAPAKAPERKSGFDANAFFAAKSGDDEDDDFAPPPKEAAPAKPAAKKGLEDFDMDIPRRGSGGGGGSRQTVDEAPRRDRDAGKAAAPAPAAAASSSKASGKANLACYLLYIDDDGANAEVRVERDREAIMIGRREPATIKVHNPSVSGTHCTVGWQDEEVVVRDLGSSNGTFINGERIRRGTLNDGDILRCGRFELRCSFLQHKDIAQAEYEEWGDDWEDDELDPGQPNFHIIYRDDRNQLTCVTMGEKEKHIAVGSRGCEINVAKREVEAEHCEFEWDDGILLVKDLKSQSGTFVNDNEVEGDESVRNADVVVVGRLRMRIVRGTSNDWEPPAAEKRSDKADLWARHLDNRDDDMELLFIDGEVDDGSGRHELSIWGNGEARIEVELDGQRRKLTGTVDRDLRKILYDGILKTGFPDAKQTKNRSGEAPGELTLFQDRDEAKILLNKKLTQRSPAYHEVLELLRGIAHELAIKD